MAGRLVAKTHSFQTEGSRVTKGMHWKTYCRLREEDWHAEEMLCHAMNDSLLGLKRRYKL